MKELLRKLAIFAFTTGMTRAETSGTCVDLLYILNILGVFSMLFSQLVSLLCQFDDHVWVQMMYDNVARNLSTFILSTLEF